jgi:hypothetical protein
MRAGVGFAGRAEEHSQNFNKKKVVDDRSDMNCAQHAFLLTFATHSLHALESRAPCTTIHDRIPTGRARENAIDR